MSILRENIKSLIPGWLSACKKLTVKAIFMLLLTGSLLLSAPLASAASPKWESPRTDRSDAVVVVKDADVQIKVAKGVIIVTSTRPVQIKVFTILGQLVSQETLPAGTSQLSLNTHGVFIVKTGDLTCKVAL